MSVPDDVVELFAKFGGDSTEYQNFFSGTGHHASAPPMLMMRHREKAVAPAEAPPTPSRSIAEIQAAGVAAAERPLAEIFERLLRVDTLGSASPLGQLRRRTDG